MFPIIDSLPDELIRSPIPLQCDISLYSPCGLLYPDRLCNDTRDRSPMAISSPCLDSRAHPSAFRDVVVFTGGYAVLNGALNFPYCCGRVELVVVVTVPAHLSTPRFFLKCPGIADFACCNLLDHTSNSCRSLRQVQEDIYCTSCDRFLRGDFLFLNLSWLYYCRPFSVPGSLERTMR
jgi:hypothetical protein